jgi:hypothetical protein
VHFATKARVDMIREDAEADAAAQDIADTLARPRH